MGSQTADSLKAQFCYNLEDLPTVYPSSVLIMILSIIFMLAHSPPNIPNLCCDPTVKSKAPGDKEFLPYHKWLWPLLTSTSNTCCSVSVSNSGDLLH